MGIINVVSKIKKIHAEDIALIDIGTFYYAYGKDAYILSYIFKYKLIKVKDENNIYSCAFPKSSLPKVTATLQNNKINYILINRRNNYDIDEKCDNKNLNTYKKWFQKSSKYIRMKIRIDNIYEYLMTHIKEEQMKEKIRKMEEILNEGRKV